jgi:hypothetical protein
VVRLARRLEETARRKIYGTSMKTSQTNVELVLLDELVKSLCTQFKISQLQKDVPFVVALRKAKKHLKTIKSGDIV